MICCEILDSRTRNSLCMNPAVSNEAEYVLSHITIAKVLAMVAMRREIKLVLSELLEEVGQSFFVLPVTRYLPPELVAAAHARGTAHRRRRRRRRRRQRADRQALVLAARRAAPCGAARRVPGSTPRCS